MSNAISNIFGELAALAATNVLPPLFAVANSTLADIEANPQEWINPLTGGIKAQAAVANIVAAVIPAENAAVPAAAQVVGGIFSAIQTKLAALGAGQTATGIGQQIGADILNGVNGAAFLATGTGGTGVAPAVPAALANAAESHM